MGEMIPTRSTDTIVEAMWEGNTTRLHVIAPCGCCCAEHTSERCPARSWNGCRGVWSELADEESWVRHYQTRHGMTREEFYG